MKKCISSKFSYSYRAEASTGLKRVRTLPWIIFVIIEILSKGHLDQIPGYGSVLVLLMLFPLRKGQVSLFIQRASQTRFVIVSLLVGLRRPEAQVRIGSARDWRVWSECEHCTCGMERYAVDHSRRDVGRRCCARANRRVSRNRGGGRGSSVSGTSRHVRQSRQRGDQFSARVEHVKPAVTRADHNERWTWRRGEWDRCDWCTWHGVLLRRKRADSVRRRVREAIQLAFKLPCKWHIIRALDQIKTTRF